MMTHETAPNMHSLISFQELDASDTLSDLPLASDEHCLPDLSYHVEYRGVPVVHVEEIPASWSAECQRSGFHVGEIAWFRRPLAA